MLFIKYVLIEVNIGCIDSLIQTNTYYVKSYMDKNKIFVSSTSLDFWRQSFII